MSRKGKGPPRSVWDLFFFTFRGKKQAVQRRARKAQHNGREGKGIGRQGGGGHTGVSPLASSHP